MLLDGPLVDGHDTGEHLNQMKHFSEQFWQGDLYPRWLLDMNTGLGSPTFFVYPPLPSYVYALLLPIAQALHINAFNFAAWTPLLLSGLTAMLWLNTFASEAIAAACAALYMAMPYHLAVDFYRRCAISECWAFVWMPLILFLVTGVVARKNWYSIWLAIAFALMVLSHLMSLAIFFVIPICLSMLLSVNGERLRSAIRVVLALGLGTVISSFYLCPALWNERYIPASRIISASTWPDNFVGFGRSLFAHSSGYNFIQMVSWSVVEMMVLVTVCALAALEWGSHHSKTFMVFWITVCGVAVFMMSRLSWPLTQHLGGLVKAIEFPWRFNGILCIGAVALLAICLSRAPADWGLSKITFSILFSLLIGTWVYAYGDVWHWYRVDIPPQRDEAHLVNESDGFFASWIAPGTDQRSSLIASSGPKVRFIEGSGTLQLFSWRSRNIEFQANSVKGGWIMINQFYYPAWRAELVNPARLTAVKVALPEGLLEVLTPPGSQRVRVEIPVSLSERLGGLVSALSVLCVVLLFTPTIRNVFSQQAH